MQDRPEHIELLYKILIEKNVPMVISKEKKERLFKENGLEDLSLIIKINRHEISSGCWGVRIFETKYFLKLLNTDDKTTPTLV